MPNENSYLPQSALPVGQTPLSVIKSPGVQTSVPNPMDVTNFFRMQQGIQGNVSLIQKNEDLKLQREKLDLLNYENMVKETDMILGALNNAHGEYYNQAKESSKASAAASNGLFGMLDPTKPKHAEVIKRHQELFDGAQAQIDILGRQFLQSGSRDPGVRFETLRQIRNIVDKTKRDLMSDKDYRNFSLQEKNYQGWLDGVKQATEKGFTPNAESIDAIEQKYKKFTETGEGTFSLNDWSVNRYVFDGGKALTRIAEAAAKFGAEDKIREEVATSGGGIREGIRTNQSGLETVSAELEKIFINDPDIVSLYNNTAKGKQIEVIGPDGKPTGEFKQLTFRDWIKLHAAPHTRKDDFSAITATGTFNVDPTKQGGSGSDSTSGGGSSATGGSSYYNVLGYKAETEDERAVVRAGNAYQQDGFDASQGDLNVDEWAHVSKIGFDNREDVYIDAAGKPTTKDKAVAVQIWDKGNADQTIPRKLIGTIPKAAKRDISQGEAQKPASVNDVFKPGGEMYTAETSLMERESSGGYVNANDAGQASIGPFQFRGRNAAEFIRQNPEYAELNDIDFTKPLSAKDTARVNSVLTKDIGLLKSKSTAFWRENIYKPTLDTYNKVTNGDEKYQAPGLDIMIASIGTTTGPKGQELIYKRAKEGIDKNIYKDMPEALLEERKKYVMNSGEIKDNLKPGMIARYEVEYDRAKAQGKAHEILKDENLPGGAVLTIDDNDSIQTLIKNTNGTYGVQYVDGDTGEIKIAGNLSEDTAKQVASEVGISGSIFGSASGEYVTTNKVKVTADTIPTRGSVTFNSPVDEELVLRSKDLHKTHNLVVTDTNDARDKDGNPIHKSKEQLEGRSWDVSFANSNIPISEKAQKIKDVINDARQSGLKLDYETTPDEEKKLLKIDPSLKDYIKTPPNITGPHFSSYLDKSFKKLGQGSQPSTSPGNETPSQRELIGIQRRVDTFGDKFLRLAVDGEQITQDGKELPMETQTLNYIVNNKVKIPNGKIQLDQPYKPDNRQPVNALTPTEINTIISKNKALIDNNNKILDVSSKELRQTNLERERKGLPLISMATYIPDRVGKFAPSAMDRIYEARKMNEKLEAENTNLANSVMNSEVARNAVVEHMIPEFAKESYANFRDAISNNLAPGEIMDLDQLGLDSNISIRASKQNGGWNKNFFINEPGKEPITVDQDGLLKYITENLKTEAFSFGEGKNSPRTLMNQKVAELTARIPAERASQPKPTTNSTNIVSQYYPK